MCCAVSEGGDLKTVVTQPEIVEDSQYYFRVSAENKFGSSKPSLSTDLIKIEDPIGMCKVGMSGRLIFRYSPASIVIFNLGLVLVVCIGLCDNKSLHLLRTFSVFAARLQIATVRTVVVSIAISR